MRHRFSSNIIFAEQSFVPTQKGRNLGFFAYRRLLENMGLVEKSSVTAFLEDYYEKHPLDNSFEGILARRSGLTKETVIALLETAEKAVFLASYNPANYYPVPTSKFKSKEVERIALSSNSENYITAIALLPDYYINEYRQRNFAI